MRFLGLLFLLLSVFQSFASFDDWFLNKTLRIDFIHAGDAGSEYFFLDELIQEPTWDRKKERLINPFDYGNYRMMAFDSASGELIYQTSWSSLFYEWQTTEEAAGIYRSFNETVLMPFPQTTVRVLFSSRNRMNKWEDKWGIFINPADIMISKENSFQCKTRRLAYHGDPSYKLDVVIIAEGYTAGQMRHFRRDAKRFMGYILGCEPFSQYRESINFWIVEAHSKESGTDIPGQNIWRQTAVNSHFYTFLSERYLTSYDHKTIRHLASNAPYDQILILVNSKKYGGSGFYNFYSMCSAHDPLSNFVAVHEFGHALAGLGDEYYSSETAFNNFYSLDVEPWEPNLTTLKAFHKKWKDLVKPGVPIPTPNDGNYENETGAFEGGGYVARGIYRPAVDCSMKSTRYNAFCPVCKRAISAMIEYYTR